MGSATIEEPHLPDGTELLTLLEKQDGILSLLVEELDLCKTEISSLQSIRQANKTPENESCPNLLNKRVKDLRQRDECCSCGDFKEGNGSLHDDIAKRFAALEKALIELKSSKVKNEILARDLESCKCELTLEKDSSTLKQAHIDRLNQLLNEERERADRQISHLTTKLSEAKCEIDRLKGELSSTVSSVEALKIAEAEKDSILNEYSERLNAESASRKQETIALNRRVAVLMQEKAVLRSSLASLRDLQFNGDINNLLEDQQNLIGTLKEECELLTDRLREERKGSKEEIRRLKRANKDLTEQLDRFIAGD